MDVSTAKPCQEGREIKLDHLQECAHPPSTPELGPPCMSFDKEAMTLLTANSLLTRSLLTTRHTKPKDTSSINRRKREFIPEEKKDSSYWDKRKKNNEAAKRSREKRRVNDMVLEQRVIALLEENARLKAEILALKFRFGLVKEPSELPITQNNPPPLCCLSSNRSTFVAGSENGCGTCPLDGKSFPPHNQQLGAVLGTGQQESSPLSEDSGISTPGSSSVGSPVFFDDHLSDQDKFSLGHFEAHLSSTRDVEVDLGRIGPSEKPARSRELMEMVKCLPHKLRFKIGAGLDENAEVDVRLKGLQMAVGYSSTRTAPEHPASEIREQLQGCCTHSTMPVPDQGSSIGLVPSTWRAQVGFLPSESSRSLSHRYLQEAIQASGQAFLDPKNSVKEDTPFRSENSSLMNQLASLSAEVAQLKKKFSQQRCSGFN
ncbi:nuclear factor interleukin-3-regulated protein-like [Narcine bancroftii]|uniref:nuclear factor interleukin-3-regulated protein-like n=1 Tax=Narcine bancroftii TaxID=1343680 RepID=UPI003831AC8F